MRIPKRRAVQRQSRVCKHVIAARVQPIPLLWCTRTHPSHHLPEYTHTHTIARCRRRCGGGVLFIHSFWFRLRARLQCVATSEPSIHTHSVVVVVVVFVIINIVFCCCCCCFCLVAAAAAANVCRVSNATTHAPPPARRRPCTITVAAYTSQYTYLLHRPRDY